MTAAPHHIDAALVRRLVTTQFPQWKDEPITPIEPGGWDNRTFRLGTTMSVRLPSAERYAAQVEKEHRWLPVLAPQLPLPIPVPLARGRPAFGYPWAWSVYGWIEGAIATHARVGTGVQCATALAAFLVALQRIDPAGGPAPGAHNFFRGGCLSVYDGETRSAIAALGGGVDASAAREVWNAARAVPFDGAPVWIHGDVSAANLLIRAGRLAAVIDFGSTGVGDPACDLTIAWTLFSAPARGAFRTGLPLDAATWARARGWALWKALITLAEHADSNPARAARAGRIIDIVCTDHRCAS